MLQNSLDSKDIAYQEGDLLLFLTDAMVKQFKHGKGSRKIPIDPEQVVEEIADSGTVDPARIRESGLRITADRQEAEELAQSLVPSHEPYAWDVRRLTSTVILIEMWRD